eukprot:4370524-Amphidinium_carterae.1
MAYLVNLSQYTTCIQTTTFLLLQMVTNTLSDNLLRIHSQDFRNTRTNKVNWTTFLTQKVFPTYKKVSMNSLRSSSKYTGLQGNDKSCDKSFEASPQALQMC